MIITHEIVCYDRLDAAQRSWALGLAKVPQIHFSFTIKPRAPEFNGGRREPLMDHQQGDVRRDALPCPWCHQERHLGRRHHCTKRPPDTDILA